jgi:glutathione S-transferase
MSPLPLLYTFRRCPYAIRARLAIAVAGVHVRECEVALRDKPTAMLAISPKGTVPVLQTEDGRVLEQSLDIMRWALRIHDPQGWLDGEVDESNDIIATNDGAFKAALDRYKYANRFPEFPAAHYREQASQLLQPLEARLSVHTFLLGETITLVDAAVFPFVRQFAAVDRAWFDQSARSGFGRLGAWLRGWEASPLFAQVMQKISAAG